MTDIESAAGAQSVSSDTEPEVDRSNGSGYEPWFFVILVIAVIALIVSLIGVILPEDGSASSSGSGETITFDVTLGDMFIEPKSIEVPAGSEVVLNVTNEGAMAHDVKLNGETGTGLLDPGASETVSLGVVSADTEAWCTVAGHREAGMEMSVVVTGATGGGESASPAATPAGPAKATTIDEISRGAVEMPDAANYTLYEDGVAKKPVDRNGPITIEARFGITEGTAEMLPGTTMDFWTFDDGIPGPMIRGRVGDTLDFTLTNPADSEMPHNVDFHAVTGPGGGAVKLDASPGAESRLVVKLVKPGVYVYHCAFPDVPTHLAHGMYGLIVVEPEGGLPSVDHEFYVMQSDFYSTAGGAKSAANLGDAGHLEFSGDNANREEPTFVVFNGRPGALTEAGALGADGSIEAGDSVRLFVGNAGPNLISSFHMIGEIFDRVYVEGSFGLVNTNVQTTLIPSGGAVAAELVVDVPGDYLLVDHSIFRTHKGAAGILTAVGDPRPDLFDPKKSSTDARAPGTENDH